MFLHSADFAHVVDEVSQVDLAVKAIEVPELDRFMTDEPATPVPYTKTWEQGHNDPWLCFHSSGTTGFPKVITHTQQTFAQTDVALGLSDQGTNQFAGFRWFLPMPMLHMVGMLLVLSFAPFCGVIPVLLPAHATATPAVVKAIMKGTRIDGAMLVPMLIDLLVADPEAFDLLKGLKSIHYTGAPLSVTAGKALSPHVQIMCAIGSTDVGAYYTELVSGRGSEDWDYVRFHPHAGLVLEHRTDGMHELVFVRNPDCAMQQVFSMHPELDRFETKDLMIEHPVRKGTWKIVGRMDDYVFVLNGDGLYVSPLEMVVEEHPGVRSALIGGQGRPVPVLLVEVVEGWKAQVETEEGRKAFVLSLREYIERINGRVHEMVKLDPDVVIVGRADRPFPRTVKDTVLRLGALKLYEKEIDEVYRRCGYKVVPKI